MKLQALFDHLVAQQFCRPEQLVAEGESGEPEQSFRIVREEAGAPAEVLVFRHIYTARIGLEKSAGDLTHILALVHAWMQENGGDDDRFTGWIGEPGGDRLSDIDLQFRFEEAVHYVAAPGYTGPDALTWQGATYKPGSQAADRATELDSVEGSTGP